MKKGNETLAKVFLTEDELFGALAGSAFEFLDKAIAEFENSAKFSTVHFAIAIELFLKARLMREHWSLLLDKPDLADKSAFFKGDARTAGVEQTITRLHKIADVAIPQAARDIFATIARHRNKMVHFAHFEAVDASGAATQQMAAEQCAGWLALRTLLTEWPEFGSYARRIEETGRKMEGHRTFLELKFQSLAAELGQHAARGGRTIDCPSCGFHSVKVEHSDHDIAEAICAVCQYFRGVEITVACPRDGCGDPVRFTSYDGPPTKCPGCGNSLSPEDVSNALDTSPAITKDNYFDHVDINCPYCSGYHTVVQHHEILVCTGCFETGTEYGVCGHCSEGQLDGVPEFSSLSGCEFCEGNTSWRDAD